MDEPRQVVGRFNTAWEHGDLDAAMSCAAEDCVFTLHVSEDVVEHAGRAVGREQIRATLAAARRHYDYILYRPHVLGVDGETVRVRVEFMGVHRASGERIGMTFRHVFVVRDGLIATCDEYHDRAKLEAYLRLIASEQAST